MDAGGAVGTSARAAAVKSFGGGLVAKFCPTLRTHARLLCPWDSISKNTGPGCHFLL